MIKRFEAAALVLRLVLGITFFIHGLAKFSGGIGNTVGWFESISLPGFTAYLVALVELLGGIALVLGLGTRIVSLLLVAVMLVAIFKVKAAAGFMGTPQAAGYELDLALLAIAAALAISGSPLFSVDRLLFGGIPESRTESVS